MGAQPLDDTSNLDPTDPDYDPSKFARNGMLYQNSAIRFSEINDGTSQTLLIGDSRFGFWSDGFSCCARFRNDRPDAVRPRDFDFLLGRR